MISLNSCSCPILSISILPIALRKEGRKQGGRKAGRLGGKKKGREGRRMKRRKEERKKGRKEERMKETLLVKPLLMTRHESSLCIPWGLWEAPLIQRCTPLTAVEAVLVGVDAGAQCAMPENT